MIIFVPYVYIYIYVHMFVRYVCTHTYIYLSIFTKINYEHTLKITCIGFQDHLRSSAVCPSLPASGLAAPSLALLGMTHLGTF
jgi:hypothetical protein